VRLPAESIPDGEDYIIDRSLVEWLRLAGVAVCPWRHSRAVHARSMLNRTLPAGCARSSRFGRPGIWRHFCECSLWRWPAERTSLRLAAKAQRADNQAEGGRARVRRDRLGSGGDCECADSSFALGVVLIIPVSPAVTTGPVPARPA
jgi:hypothetical protein